MTGLHLLSALLALCGLFTLRLAFGDRERWRIRQRLAAIIGSHAGVGGPGMLPLIGELHVAALDRRFELLGWSPLPVLLLSGGGLALLFCLVLLLDGLLSASLATVIAVAALVKMLDLLAQRTRNRFADDLPLAIDRLRQLIIAGNGMTLAFTKALRACPPHLARLLGPVALSIEHGMPLSEALHQRAARLASPDLFLLAAIVKTSTQFGGDFSSALQHFETVLHNRVRSRREIRALTSELRMTTFILLALPVVTAMGIFFANRQYIRFFIEAPQGLPALVYIAGSIGIGVLLVCRLSRVEY